MLCNKCVNYDLVCAISIQERNLLTGGGQGPCINANLITLCSGKISLCDPYFVMIAEQIRKREPNYRGFVNFEVMLEDKQVWYQRIIFGATYDFLYCLSEIFHKDIDDIIKNPPAGEDGFAASLRVYGYPYDPEQNKKYIESLKGNIVFSDGDESYIICRSGDTVKHT